MVHMLFIYHQLIQQVLGFSSKGFRSYVPLQADRDERERERERERQSERENERESKRERGRPVCSTLSPLAW